MTNAAITRLSAIFIALFLVLAVRQAWVQLVSGPAIAAKPYNPRHALLDARRGRILASDGTVLADTRGKRRDYPFGESLAQTLGYVSSRYGTSGIEEAYDRALTPADTTGDPIAQMEEIAASLQGRSMVSRGADVVTTIVPAVQRALYEALRVHDRAAGIVLDPRTGAVFAIASVPSFDPNDFDRSFSQLSGDSASPLLNRAIDGLYPPGSTFKIFTAAAALDSASATMDSHYDDPGYYTIGDFTLHDDDSEGSSGYQDITGAFALSSNVDFGQIALKMGTDTFYSYLERWGIGDSLDFQLSAQPGRVPAKASVVPGELAQMGFGQGALLMSPLQMVAIASTIAAGGNEPRPYVVREIVRNGTSNVTVPATLASPISADTAANVKNMMIAVVQRGTGRIARLPDVAVAGKTGTATNPQGRAHSWFVCFAPADNPRVAVAIIVENGGYGAAVAAPIARDVLRVALESVK